MMKDMTEEKESKEFGPYDEWEIKHAVSCLIEAEEIKNDAEKMKYVAPLLNKKIDTMTKAISSIQDLKNLAKGKMASEDITAEHDMDDETED